MNQANFVWCAMGDWTFGSTYLSIKSWRMISESEKSEAELLLACLCTLLKVSLKSWVHQTNFFTSNSTITYRDGRGDTRSAWQVLESEDSNIHQRG